MSRLPHLEPAVNTAVSTLSASSRFSGPQLFARYAFMPNRLTYCGGDDNAALFQYCIEGVTDQGLRELLKKFTGAVPYLKLIAQSNLIPDAFDARVVEAYWLGNELLKGVEARALYDSLRARFGKQLHAKDLELVLGKAPAGAHPHHGFHVLEVCPRNGWPQSLGYMDNCRVSWGKVVSLEGATLTAEVAPLQLIGNNLVLGAPELRRVKSQIDGRGMVDRAAPGDWISIHWGWACQVLTPKQLAALERWTRYHLQLANQTL
ncbi:MAG: hypothetical protein HY741_13155 [Chloroflexi bacterium]|nr:hypothetical protein [Chloroflexota bacterium]